MAVPAKVRRRLPKSAFGVPSKKKYPLVSNNGKPSRKRARNALSRVAQHGTPAEKTAVRRKVARRFPGIKVSGVKKTRTRSTRKRRSR
jgi:hypothetical protein